MFRKLAAAILALPLLLAACDEGEQKVKFGAKNFSESRILAEMMLALAEEQGVPVEGIVDYPTTQAILAAIKAGDIDVYPDYNGTGLVMLGQNPMTDGDAATQRVKELYEPLGLTWLSRIGFANNYGLALREDRAAELGVTKISDIVDQAGNLAIAIEDDFQARPLDGFVPLTDRYGMEFGTVDVVKLDDRAQVFDKVIDGDVDIAEVYTTDGQIAEYGLVLLEDDLGFFPVYEASPLARADALAAHPSLGPALESLAGKIDDATMQELNGRVDLEGRSPRAIARDALARMDLIDAGAVEARDPLMVAAEPSMANGDQSATVLRAVQRAFTGRDVQFKDAANPLEIVGAGEARLALVSADAFYDLSTPAPTRREEFEAVAVAGQNLIHLMGPRADVKAAGDIKTLITGPEGSSSARIGGILVEGLGLGAELKPMEGDNAARIQAVKDGEGDGVLIMAPEGDSTVSDAMRTGGLRLLPLEGWNEGANLVRFSFLREARIAGGTYRGQGGPIETLRTQLVLAGVSPREGDIIGDQGPAAVAVELQPISGGAVKALNDALPDARIDPALPIAASLAPVLPQPAAPMNPASDISFLSLALVIFFVWLIWLLVRPEYR